MTNFSNNKPTLAKNYKLVFSLIGFLISFISLKSQDRSLNCYMRGNKAFADKNYIAADSLFTLSLNLNPHPDTYFNRAAARKKLNNMEGYCADMQAAAALGDNEAKKYYEECVSKHFVNGSSSKTDSTNSDCDFIGNYDRHKYTSKKDTLTSYCIKDKDTTFIDPSEVILPQFPGGLNAFSTYIRTNMKYPISAIEAGISGKVYIKFTIEKDGKITNVVLLKGMTDCYDCDKEAIRVISKMQNWVPGKNKDRPIKFYYTIPLMFKIL